MSGDQETAAAMSFSASNAAAASKAVVGVHHVTSEGCTPPADQHVEHEILRGRILGQHHFLAAQVGDGLDVLADHDAVAAVGPVDLLVDAGHDAAVAGLPSVDMPSTNSGTMSSVAQPMCTLPRGVGVAHRHGVVDQHQLDLELLAVGRLPVLAGLEAVVGQDDRPPAGPDVQGEPHRVVLQRLVGRDALDRAADVSAGRNLYSLTVVTLDRRRWPLGFLAELPGVDLRLACAVSPRCCCSVDGKRHQPDHYQPTQIKRSLGCPAMLGSF